MCGYIKRCLTLPSVVDTAGTAEGKGGRASPTTFIVGIFFLRFQTAHKCKINGETLTLMFVSVDQIFLDQPF